MKLKLLVNSVAISATLLFGQTKTVEANQTQSNFEYKGYRIEYLNNEAAPEPIINSFKRQIDICEDAKVPSKMRAFFKTIPMYFVAPFNGTPGRYGGISPESKTGKITIQQKVLDGNKPIILHELLHGVHGKYIQGGFSNQQIIEFFNRAKQRFSNERSDGGSDYFLKNPKEFFAVTASIYLFGKIPRPPFNMERIRQAMPRYASFLEQTFAGE